MTTQTAIRVLDAHSIDHHMRGNVLRIAEVYCINGLAEMTWVDCPATYRDLMIWLGY